MLMYRANEQVNAVVDRVMRCSSPLMTSTEGKNSHSVWCIQHPEVGIHTFYMHQHE
jgi:hypothetical protein